MKTSVKVIRVIQMLNASTLMEASTVCALKVTQGMELPVLVRAHYCNVKQRAHNEKCKALV